MFTIQCKTHSYNLILGEDSIFIEDFRYVRVLRKPYTARTNFLRLLESLCLGKYVMGSSTGISDTLLAWTAYKVKN